MEQIRVAFIFGSILVGMLLVTPAHAQPSICGEDFLLYASSNDLKKQLEAGADPNELCEVLNVEWWSSLYDATAIQYFVHINDLQSVRILLEYGADPNLPDGDIQNTALDWAAMNLCTEMVSELLDAGASPNISSPLFMALLYGRPANFPHFNMRFECENHNFESVVQLLLAAGAEPNYETTSSLSLLPLAQRPAGFSRSQEEVIAVFDALLEAGAEVNSADEFGKTPLHYAAEDGEPWLVIKLLDAMANRAVRDHEGKLAYDYAIENDAFKDEEGQQALGELLP